MEKGVSQNLLSLECYHEEADDRILVHVHHMVSVDKVQRIVVASTDTDVLLISIGITSITKIDFESLVPTTSSTRLHIKRAYYQCHRWSNALSAADGLDPLDYGYIESYGNVCNWALAVYGLLYHLGDFATHLLMIFMANLMLYCIFYIVMKLCNHERILPQPLIYIILAFTTWVAALYFFLNKSISWALTPAQSRAYNHTCDIWDFYDKHDIWHFLSAASMFFSFMVLLTLDDDLIRVHRSNIPVF
uniref:SID1-like protein n=1 Tax=Timema bartmani TaxID=61472 RepID=A0A7R9FC16_9NEOP|nr:unnamed protein product [Timema bartmani]